MLCRVVHGYNSWCRWCATCFAGLETDRTRANAVTAFWVALVANGGTPVAAARVFGMDSAGMANHAWVGSPVC
jgi:hypothetical protein